MTELYIFTRDGKAYNDFLNEHNYTKSNTKLIRSISEIKNKKNGRFVLLNPLPTGFNRILRSYLIDNDWINMTSHFNHKHF